MLSEGTLVFTDIKSTLVNDWLHLKWTHVLIWLDGWYYEATWPHVKAGPKYEWRQQLVLPPRHPYAAIQVAGMVEYAEKNLGRRYSIEGYRFPDRYGKTAGIYCSQFACECLRAGMVGVPHESGYDPDKLLAAVKELERARG